MSTSKVYALASMYPNGTPGQLAARATSERIEQYFKTTDISRGFSVNVNGDVPTSGYMVALAGYESKVLPWEASEDDCALEYFVDHAKLFADNPNLYLGGWQPDDELFYYFDVSENIQDYRHAVIAGRKRNQLAIWDVANGRSIDI